MITIRNNDKIYIFYDPITNTYHIKVEMQELYGKPKALHVQITQEAFNQFLRMVIAPS